MSSILVINAAGRETRVALVENGHISEFYLERKKDKGVVGNIYKGRVVRVLPGMQAAFVEIGLEKAAFLYVGDVVYDPEFARAQFELTEGEHEELSDNDYPEDGQPHDSEGLEDPSQPRGAPLREEDRPSGSEILRAALSQSAAPGEEDSGREASAATEAPSPDAEAAPPTAPAETAAAPEQPSASPEPDTAPEAAEVSEPSPAEPSPAVAESTPPGVPAVSPGAIIAALPSEERSEPAAETPAASTAEASEASSTSADAASEPEGNGSRPVSEKPDGEVTGAIVRKSEAPSPRERRARNADHDRKQGSTKAPRKEQRIEDVLKVGQEVVVQISKDPIGTKGARLTSHLSIPGRHLVFMPTVDHVGISRRISNEKERRRLREIVDRLRPPGTGFIVRTVAENVPEAKLESDIRFLIEIWNEVVRRNEKRQGPGLLHPDLDLILRATRDLFAQDVEKLVVDDREEHERISQFVAAQDPALRDRVILHDNEEPIFDAYGIEQEIQRATQRKVWLKSGGYLIIDQAEALTAIDVNSGRYVGKKSLEETITKINVEAAKEIVYQLRLRNIGGIIICDFIDMEKSQNRDKVFKSLQEALGRDKAKTHVLRISELGLVEMTRKRVRESIGRVLHEDCWYCDGKGFVKTATTVAYEIFREIRREAPNFKDPVMVIHCSDEVARLLQTEEREELRYLMDRYNKTLQVRAQSGYHREQYDLFARANDGAERKVSTAAPSHPMGSEVAAAPDRGRGDDRLWEEHRRDRDRGRGRNRRPERGRSGRPGRGGGDRQQGSEKGKAASSSDRAPSREASRAPTPAAPPEH